MHDHDSLRAQINAQLRQHLLRRAPAAGRYETAIPGLAVVRHEQADTVHFFYKPLIGLVVQGYKRNIVGGVEYCYGPNHCLVAGVDMPSKNYLLEASPTEPFLSISIELNKALIAQLSAVLPSESLHNVLRSPNIAVMEADTKVMQAFLRLVELLDEPEEIPIMAEILIREIHHRILIGPHGAWLCGICALGAAGQRVAQAVGWLRENYKIPLQVEDLAHQVGMSSSSFFRNFKLLTTLSPLQFQKTLRLYEAQRLLLTDECNVADAAYAVGYESSTQFIREYKRLFGEPPYRNVCRKRSAP